MEAILYLIGEYNIYRLPDLNDFDSIIVDLNNIRYPKVRDYVISSAKATGKPVLSIANEIADFYYVGIDNYSAMQEMVALHGKLPDAIICTNDNIAVGVCETMAAYGCRVPDDFLMPGFDNFDKASYILRTSQRSDICEQVGYFVIRKTVYLTEKQYLFQITNVLTSAMENLHKKERLAYLNQVLSELYVKDAMTGMYNRLGYQKLACRMFEEKKQTGENLSIIFMDMDRLKSINDEFGHIYGDWAIKTIASAILKYIPEGAVAVRSGGDEFLVVLEQTADAEIGKIIGEIRKEIRERSAEMKLPFPLTVSAGCVHTDMTTGRDLDDYVREADAIMYEEKTAKKANRT